MKLASLILCVLFSFSIFSEEIPKNLDEVFNSMEASSYELSRGAVLRKKNWSGVEGELYYEMQKWLKKSDHFPFKVCSYIFSDFKRISIEIYKDNQKLNLPDKNEFGEEEYSRKIFETLKNGLVDQLKKNKKKNKVSTKVIEKMIHLAMASRTQLFSSDSYSLLKAEVRQKWKRPIEKIIFGNQEKLSAKFLIQGNGILAYLEEPLSVYFVGESGTDPLEVGKVLIERYQFFNPLSRAKGIEKVSIVKEIEEFPLQEKGIKKVLKQMRDKTLDKVKNVQGTLNQFNWDELF